MVCSVLAFIKHKEMGWAMMISINYQTCQFRIIQSTKPDNKQTIYPFLKRAFLGVMICLGMMFPLVSYAGQEGHIDTNDAIKGVGILDGLTFTSRNGQYGKPGDHSDTLIFKDGTFVSTDCEKNCNYPAQAYFTRHVGDKIEFISETRCLTQDAEIVWRGVVDGKNIEGTYSWRSSRWYWTIEKEFWFKGSLEESKNPAGEN